MEMTQEACFEVLPSPSLMFLEPSEHLEVSEDAEVSAWRQCQDAPTEHTLVHKKSLLPLHTSS